VTPPYSPRELESAQPLPTLHSTAPPGLTQTTEPSLWSLPNTPHLTNPAQPHRLHPNTQSRCAAKRMLELKSASNNTPRPTIDPLKPPPSTAVYVLTPRSHPKDGLRASREAKNSTHCTRLDACICICRPPRAGWGYPYIYLSFYLSIYLSVCLSTHLSMHLSIYEHPYHGAWHRMGSARLTCMSIRSPSSAERRAQETTKTHRRPPNNDPPQVGGVAINDAWAAIYRQDSGAACRGALGASKSRAAEDPSGDKQQ
jgi:hypothetical protein